jgi:hypothetical protein
MAEQTSSKRLADEAANNRPSGSMGIGVDAFGGAVIDPTRNVLDLVHAESKYQDGMRDNLEKMLDQAREYEAKLQHNAKDAESKLQTLRADAESKRIDQLAELRQIYDKRIADMLSESVRSTSSLVSTQLVQIQATFDARVSKLEEFRWQSTGRSSVADPALSASLEALGSSIGNMQSSFAETLGKLTAAQSDAMTKVMASISALQESGSSTKGQGLGRRDVAAWVFAGLMALAAVAGPIITIVTVTSTTHSTTTHG